MGNYRPQTPQEEMEMLRDIGYSSIDELYSDIPEDCKLKGKLNIPDGLSELEVEKGLKKLASENVVYEDILRGAGSYRHYIPSIVKSVISKEEFVTAYTPYQAEISQGVLQNIFEFQAMVCELTGMDAANASVYDGSNAAAEAVAMSRTRKKNKVLVARTVHPDMLQTVKTYCFGNGMEVVEVEEADGAVDFDDLKSKFDDGTASILIQSPNFYGIFEAVEKFSDLAKEYGALTILSVNPMALGLVKSPREMGADIAVCEGQPFGIPISFGGPYLGIMATTSRLQRNLPGRIVGQTTDVDGKRAYVLTLQAREQHIRREKASSNVCSNQALCALTGAVYLSTMGPGGLREVAVQATSHAHYLQRELEKIGFKRTFDREFFHEFVTESPIDAGKVNRILSENNILGPLELKGNRLLWCTTELNRKETLDRVVELLKEAR